MGAVVSSQSDQPFFVFSTEEHSLVVVLTTGHSRPFNASTTIAASVLAIPMVLLGEATMECVRRWWAGEVVNASSCCHGSDDVGIATRHTVQADDLRRKNLASIQTLAHDVGEGITDTR